MPEYKRWVSYIYYYEDNIKKNNIGYIRVEIKGATTKLTVHINVLSVTEPMGVYMCVRDNGKMKGIPAGKMIMDKGVGHCIYNIDTYNVMKSPYSIEDIAGVIILYDKSRFYASEWDDDIIDIDKFSEYQSETENRNMKRNHEEEEKLKGAQRQLEEEENLKGAQKQQELNNHKETQKQNERENDIRLEAQTVQENEEEQELYKDSFTDEDSDNYRQSINNYRMPDEATEKENETGMQSDIAEAAEDMLKTFPYMYPFEDDEIDACVRIEPQDIEKLPIDNWLLANNSFLLKGYFGYRHLIFIKIGRDQPRYMIGVPGINHNRENYLANMFGFRLFKPIKNTSEVKGEFGYWCIGLNKYM